MAKTAIVEISNFNPQTKLYDSFKKSCTIIQEYDTSYRVRVNLNGEDIIIRKNKKYVEFPDAPKRDEKKIEKQIGKAEKKKKRSKKNKKD